MNIRWLTRRTLVTRTLPILGLGAVAGVSAGCDRSDKQSSKELPQAFRYDIAKLAADDGGLPRFRLIRSLDTGLVGASAMTSAPDGNLAIAHEGQVVTLDPTGRVVRRWSTDHRVRAVHISDDETVFVADRRQVARHNAAGRRLESWTLGDERAMITGIAATGDDLFVADAGHRTVSRYRAGDPVWQLQGFHIPSPYFDLAIAPDGLLWVAHTGRHRLEAYDLTGDMLRSWGKAGVAVNGFSGCCNPCHFAILGDGRFITSEKGLHRVKLHDPEGEVKAMVITAPEMDIDVNKPVYLDGKQNAVPSGPLVAGVGQLGVAVLNPRTGGLHLLQPPDEVS